MLLKTKGLEGLSLKTNDLRTPKSPKTEGSRGGSTVFLPTNNKTHAPSQGVGLLHSKLLMGLIVVMVHVMMLHVPSIAALPANFF